MKNVRKLDSIHAEKFGILGISGSFYSLINRLQVHSELKYPTRKWDNNTYYSIALQWVGKEKKLKKRVLKLEKESLLFKKL